MKRFFQYVAQHRRRFAIVAGLFVAVWGLLLYKLGTLTAGLSPIEVVTANSALGWHGLYNHPFYFPLNFIRSIVFFAINDYGDFLIRLPNTLFGLLGVGSFAYVVRRWHGVRTALFATALFATSAWLLHVSRLASFDVMYLSAVPLLLASGLLLQRYGHRPIVFYGSAILWGALLYTPGIVWLVGLTVYWQRATIAKGWMHFNSVWQRFLYLFVAFAGIPLLLVNLMRPHQFVLWIGAPTHFAAPLTLLKEFIAVFVHLFIRGPQYPELWLGRLPILDVFILVMCIFGIYFYAKNRNAQRSRLLLSYFAVSVLLVTLQGPVSISVLVPLLYIVAATGIAYLLHEWLQVFPMNPFARGLGIALISIAVLMSCAYNIRSYFVAWPHNHVTQATFRYHR